MVSCRSAETKWVRMPAALIFRRSRCFMRRLTSPTPSMVRPTSFMPDRRRRPCRCSRPELQQVVAVVQGKSFLVFQGR